MTHTVKKKEINCWSHPFLPYSYNKEESRCSDLPASNTMSNIILIRYDACLLVACLTSQQHARVSQGQICWDNCTCCHTETEVADQTFYLTQSQYTDTGHTSPSTDPTTPGAWQGSLWRPFYVSKNQSCRISVFTGGEGGNSAWLIFNPWWFVPWQKSVIPVSNKDSQSDRYQPHWDTLLALHVRLIG